MWRRRKRKEKDAAHVFCEEVRCAHDGDTVVTPTGVSLTVKRSDGGCVGCVLETSKNNAILCSTPAYDKQIDDDAVEKYGITCVNVACTIFMRGVGKGDIILVENEQTIEQAIKKKK